MADESADLLGNFDDEKRKQIFEGTYVDIDVKRSDSESEEDGTANGGNKEQQGSEQDSDNTDDDDDEENDEINTDLSSEQLGMLMRGAAKANRFVLYVTNLNFETSKEVLESVFGAKGTVKSIRIPKKRRGGFAFVEMADVASFQRGFQLHNTELDGRKIKVQISEAGKKKSANKKNIIKQKNRRLAEMRNEQKTFTKSGKFYDKTLKKEKAKEMLARKRWRKPQPRPS